MTSKILIDGLVFDLQKSGGISRLWATLIPCLERGGLDFNYIENRTSPKNIFRNQITIGCPLKTRMMPSMLLKYTPYNNFFDKSEIYIPTYYRPVSSKIKNIQVCHDTIREESISKLYKNLLISRRRIVYNNASLIICVSKSTKDDLLNLYGSHLADKCMVIHNPVTFVNQDHFGNSRIIENFLHGGKYAIYIGARSGAKNFLSDTIDLLTNTPHLKLIVVGSSFTAEEEGALFSFKDRILNVGRIDDYTLRCAIKNAAFLLLTSSKEGFGYPTIEAMLLGTPVVCQDNPINREISLSQAFYYSGKKSISISEAAESAMASGSVCESIINAIKIKYDPITISKKYIGMINLLRS